MPTMLRQPNGKACRTTLGKLRRATCSRCHYIWYAYWNCTTGTWSKSLTSYCGYCLPSWAVTLDGWIKLSAGQYGWAHIGGDCICSGQCNSGPAEPADPAVTPPQTAWYAYWQCAAQAWQLYCNGATDAAVTGWTAGVCAKTCVVTTGETPTAPATPADQSVCCKAVEGGTWTYPDPIPPCTLINYLWQWTCDGITPASATSVNTCGAVRAWDPAKICNNYTITATSTPPANPPQIPTCIHIWIVTCAGDWSDYKICVTDAQLAALQNGDPVAGLPRGAGSGWVMDPIGCRLITWTIGDTPPAGTPLCPTFVYHWQAAWHCGSGSGFWELRQLANTPRLPADWGPPGDCAQELFTVVPGTPAMPPNLSTADNDRCCEYTAKHWATWNCATASWDVPLYDHVSDSVGTPISFDPVTEWTPTSDPCVQSRMWGVLLDLPITDPKTYSSGGGLLPPAGGAPAGCYCCHIFSSWYRPQGGSWSFVDAGLPADGSATPGWVCTSNSQGGSIATFCESFSRVGDSCARPAGWTPTTPPAGLVCP